jgi:hypothetical protein
METTTFEVGVISTLSIASVFFLFIGIEHGIIFIYIGSITLILSACVFILRQSRLSFFGS